MLVTMSGKRYDSPTNLDGWLARLPTNPRARVLFAQRDETAFESLMLSPPGGPDRGPSLEETALLREALGRAIDGLSPEDRWIVERLLIEGMSLRKTGAVLGIPKTTLARRRDYIKRRLALVLTDDPTISGWITRED